MKQLIVGLFMLGSVSAAYAADSSIHTDGQLTAEQRAQIEVEANQMAAKNRSTINGLVTETDSAKKFKEWADIGTAVGAGLVGAAKELGVAANEFANTPVGRMVTWLIIWHFFGSQVIHVVLGLIWLTVFLSVTLYLYRREAYEIKVTMYEKDKGPNGVKKVKERDRIHGTGGSEYAVLALGGLVTVLGSMIIFLNA